MLRAEAHRSQVRECLQKGDFSDSARTRLRIRGACDYILSSWAGSWLRVLRDGRRYPNAACTLDGRHIAPPRSVGTPSALSWSANPCSVMLALRIAVMRST